MTSYETTSGVASLEAPPQTETPVFASETLNALQHEDDSDSLELFPRRVSRSEIIYLTSQLAIMVDTGINLAAALEGIRAQEDNPSLRKILGQLKSDVESGEDFSTALAKHPKHFDKTFVALVTSSEQTGTLGEILEHIACYLRKDMDNRSKVRSAMTYPMIMLVMAIGVSIFLLTYIMPKFTPLFSRKGMKLPTITAIFMQISHYLIDYWYVWLILAVLSVVGFFALRRMELGRRWMDRLKINLPILGPTFRKVIVSRGIRTLGTMLKNGVPMLDALQLTADVSGNVHYEAAWTQAKNEVTNGCRVCNALAGNPLFPKTLVQMIASGEETGRLGFVLEKVSSYYDGEVETSLKTATSMIEPLMISVMGVVVGSIGLSLLLPIFTLSRSH
ncbi:MAG: type II secretion system F family protein [Pirellulaceae bacterium]